MDNQFASFEDTEYLEGFVDALVAAYEGKEDTIHPVEDHALYLIRKKHIPLVWRGQSLVASIDASPVGTVRDIMEGLFHLQDEITIPILLPKSCWTGQHGDIATAIKEFAETITAMASDQSRFGMLMSWKVRAIPCPAVAAIAESSTGLPVALIDGMSSLSHDMLHRNGDDGDPEDGSLITDISAFLKGQ